MTHAIRHILESGFRSDLSWPKLGLEPKCHDPGTFFTFFALDKTLSTFKKKYKTSITFFVCLGMKRAKEKKNCGYKNIFFLS